MDFRRLFRDEGFQNNLKLLGIAIIVISILAILASLDFTKEFVDVADNVGPKVVRVSTNNADGIYTINQVIEIVVEFNEEINIALGDAPKLALELDNGIIKYAEYVDDSSNTEMTFRYPIKKGDVVKKLKYPSEDALVANGTVIRDRNGNLSSLLLPLPTSDNSLGGNSNIRIITEDPYAIITEFQKTQEMKEFTITFNRKVKDFDITDIEVYEGAKANFRVIEENRIFKVDVTRSTTLDQTIVVPSNVCYDIESGVPNTYSVPIPKGFYYCGGLKENGIVISDSEFDSNAYFYGYGQVTANFTPKNMGNNYAWVPIDYINDDKGVYNDGSNKLVENSRFGRRDYGEYGYGTFKDYSETIPDALITSIKKYNGFFVGCYEGIVGSDGRMGSKPSVKNPTGYVGRTDTNDKDSLISIYNYVNASNAASAINKTYTAKSSVVAHLPYGAEWDTLMKWLEECGANVAEDSSSWGNYSNTEIPRYKVADRQDILETGVSKVTEMNHIYDLAGNLWEWTQEKTSQGNVVRGGVYGNYGHETPAAYRTSFGSNVNLFLCTSRPFLYVR